MLRAMLLSIPLVLSACGSDGPLDRTVARPGHGAVSVAVEPNPIVARPIGDEVVGLPFDVVIAETGGMPVDVQTIVLNVRVAGTSVWALTITADELRAAGQPTAIDASGSVRYAFHPKARASGRLLSAATGEVTVVAADRAAVQAVAATSVGLR